MVNKGIVNYKLVAQGSEYLVALIATQCIDDAIIFSWDYRKVLLQHYMLQMVINLGFQWKVQFDIVHKIGACIASFHPVNYWHACNF